MGFVGRLCLPAQHRPLCFERSALLFVWGSPLPPWSPSVLGLCPLAPRAEDVFLFLGLAPGWVSGAVRGNEVL